MSDRYAILVVEDDMLISMEMGERLTDMGYDVVGPAQSLEAAEAAIAARKPDAALLDANIAGASSVELGAKLAGMGVPVAFCTGYDSVKNLPPSLQHAPILTKPISDHDLQTALKRLLA
ncbi:MAG: response regulator [Hyphomonadaceae bacterium]